MKKHFILLLILPLFLFVGFVNAQSNILRVNAPSLVIDHYYFTYERILGDRVSFTFSVGYKPEGEIRYKEEIVQWTNLIPDNEKLIEYMDFTGVTITPEIRFYTSRKKKAPEGFYFSPYLRYSTYSISTNYLEEDISTEILQVFMDAKWSMVGGGLMIGHQWLIKETVSIDLGILGIGYKSATFNSEVNAGELSTEDMNELDTSFKKDFDDLGEFLTHFSSNNIKGSLEKEMIGIRLGLSIGIAF